jgi:PAS domain S-box-containing protein
MTRDVTEHRKAQQELRKSEEHYRAVVEQIADAIFLIDGATRRIIEANAGFHALLGYAPEDLQGMSMYDLVPHDREGVDANIRQV